ncbi:MAG TPA: hypothetical protein VE081_14790 [Sporichthyaceae bacterium]|nr:hypothetical protein [Sporichthyaceae bacterium]
MRSMRLPAALALVLLASGCGGGGTRTVDLTAPAPTATASSDVGMASLTPLPSDLPAPTGPDANTTSAAPSSAALTSAPSAGPAATNGIALPPLGNISYPISGQSSIGTLPDTLRLGITDAGGGAQTWRLDTTNPDGTGLMEELTVGEGPDGLYLSGYRLAASGGLWHLDLQLAPAAPVPLVPSWPHGSWEFDMPSSNGCQNAHTVGTVLPADFDGARHVRLVTTTQATGKAGCAPIQVSRTQELWLPADGGTPGRIDTDLSGSTAGGVGARVQYRTGAATTTAAASGPRV